jgi:uncharacterized membrane protein YjdF
VKPRPPLLLILFTIGYMVAAIIGAIVTGNREFIFYIVVMALLISIVLTVHQRSNLSAALLWALSVWGLLHMAGGLVSIPTTWPYDGPHNVLYSLWVIPDKLKYDQIVHAYGFGITTWLCWQALRNGIRARYKLDLPPTGAIMLLCAAAGMGFGALNEVVEFFATLALPETNVGGYVNTGWDLVFNAIGSAIAALIIHRHGRR